MDYSKKKFEINEETVSEKNGKSFFHMPEMDLSGPDEKKSRLIGTLASKVKTSGAPDKETPKSTPKPINKPVAEKVISNPTPAPAKPPVNRHSGMYGEYEKFKEKRIELTHMINHTAGIMQRLEMFQLKEKLSDLSDRIERDTFKVQIVGNFKNGKSTFINSFLGAEILPAYALPCTAVINEVKYGETKRAIIHFKNPLPPILPKELSPAALNHIKRHGPGRIPPMEVPYDKIEDYVVIPMGKDPKDMLLESPYERVELFWPLELLKNGIEIIDSPGLNEHTTRTKVTMDFLTKSDAIIFVLNATMLCSRDEMTFIEKTLHSNGFKDLFFVVNRFDMIPPNEQKRIAEYAKKNLSSLTNLGDKGLFFLSAKNALEAKIERNNDKLIASGLPQFEKTLSTFLTKKKGSMKLTAPSRSLLNFLQEEALKKIIPQHIKKLSLSTGDIEKSFHSIKEELDTLERKFEFFTGVVQTDIRQLSYSFEPLSRNHINKVTGSIQLWTDSYIPVNKFGLLPSKNQIDIITDEIMEYIRLELENATKSWYEKDVAPEIARHSSLIFEPVKRQIDDLLKEFNSNKENDIKTDAFKQMNARFMSASGARSVSSTDMMRISTQITGTPLMTVMSSFSSSSAKAKAKSSFITMFMNLNSSALPKLKAVITNEVKLCINEVSAEFAKSINDEISVYFNDIANKVLAVLDSEISSTKNRLDAVSVSKMRKESDIDSKKKQLLDTELEIKQLCSKIKAYSESF